ncbi:GumC family protein [Sphingomonas desiccabilis]|uniref:Polysaccharide biosynthesis tyrosine autokinase n=1 Tax=Sphingomonas desiccabilis TaxID=429134 RepID=A0A4V1QP68_9SPHN|nr:polysaccharide biosynthesis tyrosine autokinase [Sphingomonas desiccabilis]MBB3911071.1 capsular exopolysaccharide synthesis family protein [Sphingomonas desiccabilis]RXZ32114.1 polysaccharide biosynthesis tyrosine autokinase [Sphingomonas desiccabilis]
MSLASVPVAALPRAAEPAPDAALRIDLTALLSILGRNRLLIAATLATALLGGLMVTLLISPRYVATASIQIDQEADRVLEGAEVQPQAGYADADRFLQTQADVLRSRTLAIRVAQRLKLFGDPAFFHAMEAAAPQEAPTTGETARSRDATLRLLQEQLAAALPRNSRVARIAFESTDAALAARIANAYADEFIAANLQRKFDSSAYARDFLSRQLAAAKLRLEDSERALTHYARAARLIRTADTGEGSHAGIPGSVTAASLVQLNGAANDARAARIAAEQKWRAISPVPVLNIPEVLGNQAVERLLEQRAAGAAELQRERARHLSEHPSVRQLEFQQAELDRQVSTLATAIRSSIHDQYRDALGRERALAAQVEGLKQATLAEQDRGVRYAILAREADTNRTLYDGLLQRYKELSAAAGINANNLSIVDRAEPPLAPSSPKLALNLLVALTLGLILAGATVLVREQFDDAVRAPDEVEGKLGLPLLGAIPRVQDIAAEVVRPRSPAGEAYNALRSALVHASPHGLPRTLLVTSSQPGEGKSTTSYAIAAGLARLDRRVVLVDLDLRRPSLHRMLELPNDCGVSDVLARQARLESALQDSRALGLAVLTAGAVAPNPAELLGSASMAEMMAALVERFETIVLDAPPVLGLADAPTLAAQAEATVFVVEAGRRSRGATKDALRRLRAGRAAILGLVLTKFDLRTAGMGHYRVGYYDYGEAEPLRQAAE